MFFPAFIFSIVYYHWYPDNKINLILQFFVFTRIRLACHYCFIVKFKIKNTNLKSSIKMGWSILQRASKFSIASFKLIRVSTFRSDTELSRQLVFDSFTVNIHWIIIFICLVYKSHPICYSFTIIIIETWKTILKLRRTVSNHNSYFYIFTILVVTRTTLAWMYLKVFYQYIFSVTRADIRDQYVFSFCSPRFAKSFANSKTFHFCKFILNVPRSNTNISCQNQRT